MAMCKDFFSTVIILLVTLHASVSGGYQCFDCNQQSDPYACNAVRQCGDDELCFTSFYYLDSFPTPFWDSGCKAKSFCNLVGSTNKTASQSSHKRESGSNNIRMNSSDELVVRNERQPHKLVVCNFCCQGSFCNRLPCDESSQKLEPKGLVCHSCSGVTDPSSCTQTARCGQDEVCAVWTLASGLVSLGCKAKTVCASEGNNLLFGKRDTQPNLFTLERGDNSDGFAEEMNSLAGLEMGLDNNSLYKRQMADSQCRQCCSDNMCAANYCSKKNTLPPGAVTATMPTTPTTTLRPLNTRLVPVIVSTFEGDNATFACDVSGQPPFDIKFSRTFNGNMTTSRIFSCDYQSTLPVVNKTCTFFYTKLNESSSVSCTVTDGYGQVRTGIARLDVEIYKNMTVNIRPKTSDLLAGNKTTIECSIQGIIPPSCQWFRNASGSLTKLKNSSVFNITNNNNILLLEVMPNPYDTIDGSYVCQANNRLEIVNLPFSLHTITHVNAIQNLSDISLDSSQKDVTFSCSFQSYPPPSVSWDLMTSSNQTLTLSGNSSVSSVTQNRTTTSVAVVRLDDLKINKVKSIKCTGDNGYFTNFSRAEIRLLKPPHITTPAKSYHVKSGQFLSLKCEAEGEPKPYISWNFVDEYDMPQIVQYLDILDDGKVLEVSHFKISGKFSCYASNSVGMDSIAFQVTVV